MLGFSQESSWGFGCAAVETADPNVDNGFYVLFGFVLESILFLFETSYNLKNIRNKLVWRA